MRIVLVVEDDRDINDQNAFACRRALKELADEGLDGQWQVKQAFTYEEADAILQQENVDFISVDLALTPEETTQGTERTSASLEPGGFRLLESLQLRQKRPLAVVFSGETIQDYAIDAYNKYRILRFYQKGRVQPNEEFKHAVKAALWYLAAVRMIEGGTSAANLRRAEEYRINAINEAMPADISVSHFPEELRTVVEPLRQDKRTKLASQIVTEATLTERAVAVNAWEDEAPPNWGVVLIAISGFQMFVEYAASQEDGIYERVGALLSRARTNHELTDDDYFAGHWTADSSTQDPRFLVILTGKGVSYTEAIAEGFTQEFNKFADNFASVFDEDAPKLAATVGTLTSEEVEKPSDTHELINHINQIDQS